MASWAAGAGRSSGGVVGAIVPPKKKVPEFTLMHYVANNCKYDLDSDATSSSEESVGALKAANDRRVNESLQQAREHLMMRDEFPSDEEEDAGGRKKALEMIHKMEYMRNQKDTWKVLGEKKRREQDVLSLHPLQRNNDEEYFSGVQKAKSKVRKRNRPSETLVLDEGFFQQPEVSGPQGAPPGEKAPKVRVPSTGLPFKPGPPLPKKNNPWMQRSGADLFSAAQSRTIVAYGVTVQNEEEALALAIAESIRTANEEKNRQLMINLAPPVYDEAIDHGWTTDPPQTKRIPPDPPHTSWDTDDEEKPNGLFCHSVETKEKKSTKSAIKTKTFDEFSFHSDKPLEFKDDPECVQNMSGYGAKRKKFVSPKDTFWDEESKEKQPQMPLSSLQRSKEKDLLFPKQKKAFDDLSLHSDESVDFEEAHDIKNASFGKVESKKEMAHFRPLENSPQQCSYGSSAQEKSGLTKQNSAFTTPEMSAISLPQRQRTSGRSSDCFLTNQKVTHLSSGRETNVPAKSAASNFDIPLTETESMLMHDSAVVVQKEVLETNKPLIPSNEKTSSFEEQQPSGTNACDLTYKEVEGNTGTSKGTSFFSKEAAQSMRPPVTASLEAVKESKSENGMEPKIFLNGDGNLPSTNQDTSHTMLRGSSLQDKPSRLPKSLPVGAGGCSRSSPSVKEETVDSSSPKSISDVSEAQQFLKFETAGMKFPASTPNQNFLESLVNNNMQGIEAMKLNGSSNNTAPLQDILTNMYAPQVTPSLNNQNFGLMAQSAQGKQGIENSTNNVLPPFGQQNLQNFSSQMSQCPPFMTPELMAQIMPQMMFPVLSPQFTQMVPQMSPDIMGNMAMYQMALQQQYEQQMRQAMACYGLPQMGQTPSEMSPNLNVMQGIIGSSQLKGQAVGPQGLGSFLTPGSLPSAEMRPGLNISPPAKGRGRLRPSMLQ